MKERVQIIWRIPTNHSYYLNKHCSIKGSILNYVLEMQCYNRNHIHGIRNNISFAKMFLEFEIV